MRLKSIAVLPLLLFAVVPAYASPGDDVPSWVQQAAALKPPVYDKDVPAVVLVDDGTKTIDSEGRVTEVYNYAVRILKREGREYAIGRAGYNTDSGKVKELRAWLVRPNGDIKRYGKDETVDLAAVDNDVYNEFRLKSISAINDTDAGMVFAFSFVKEDRSVFSQDNWGFQSSIPVLNSRFTLSLPSGWRAEGLTFNHPKVEPRVTGSTYSWELSNLPAIPEEPLSPSLSNLVARLAVSYYPPAGQATSIKTFADWAAVATWMTELEDPQVLVDDALSRKAFELTALAKTEFDKIQAISRYVQNVQYISIQTGVGRGGGYRPRSSTEVFAKSYGDCKDKANLMRAMLKVVGISSFPVSIYSGDPNYVKPEWPSPQQFNHCIIAVKVGDQTQASTIVRHPTLGRLMIFDPTDSETPLGDLSQQLQGSLALIDSLDSKELTQMPVMPPEMNRLERNATLVLQANGALAGSIQEQAVGQVAARWRTQFRGLSRPEYNALIERWVTQGANAAKVAKIEPSDNAADGEFSLNIEFSAEAYAQLMRDRLLVFKPAIVSRREGLTLTAPQRKHPVVLRSNAFTETAKFQLPVGFDVDEIPDPVKLEAEFGSYLTSYEVKNGELIFKRTFSTRAMTIPVARYEAVRDFFERIRAAEQAPVVLARK
jgi:transglutaminase-like putative cysteine protease